MSEIKVGNKYRKVMREKFQEYINRYDNKCGNCLTRYYETDYYRGGLIQWINSSDHICNSQKGYRAPAIDTDCIIISDV
ncbi:MAG: hypothetical protein KAQ85_03835 [Thermodesulfovibrionia bacterium]|nr:hypothetical protein [Thermodesulfovibrionia bacterium]